MKALIAKCIAGANTLELCKFGDEQIVKEASSVFKKEKEMLKGAQMLNHLLFYFIY